MSRSNAKRFSVPCVAEIDNHIGPCRAWIVAHDPDDFEIECLTNNHDGERSGESVTDGLWQEIAEEVRDWFMESAINAVESSRETP